MRLKDINRHYQFYTNIQSQFFDLPHDIWYFLIKMWLPDTLFRWRIVNDCQYKTIFLLRMHIFQCQKLYEESWNDFYKLYVHNLYLCVPEKNIYIYVYVSARMCVWNYKK